MDTVGRHVSRLSGYAPALPTPFGDDGSVDHPCLQRYCNKLVHAGATALVVCTATAEAPALTAEERRAIVATAAAAARGGVPVIAATGSHATDRVAEFAAAAERAGADAVLCAPPPPAAGAPEHDQDRLLAHFRGVAAATSIPLIIDDLPRSGITEDTIAALAEDPRFIGVLLGGADPGRAAALRSRLGEPFRILSGNDRAAMAMIGRGANGCISVTANVAPGLCRSLYLAVRRGHAGLAGRIAAEVARLDAVLCQHGDAATLKYALSLAGLMSDRVRPPVHEADDQLKAAVAAALAHFCEYNPDDGIGLAVAAIRVPAAAKVKPAAPHSARR